jgi:hypothetical protein
MFKLESEDSLIKSFRPRDRKHVEVPRDLKFPAFVHHYLAWRHPAGGKVYLVFAVPNGLATGIVFDANGAGPAVPHMCHWCHCASTGGDVELHTAKLSGKKTVGVYVCADLNCRKKLEEEADRSGRSTVPAMAALLEQMGRFASEGLGIDLHSR